MAFDPKDPDTKAAIEAAIEKATGPLKESIEALETKRDELIGDVRKAKQAARQASEIKPEDYAAAEDRAEKAEAKLAELDKSVKTLTGERDKAVKALETEQGYTSKLLIQDGLKSALIANGVKDETFIEALSAQFSSGATIKTDGDNRVAMFGDKALGDYIKEWAGTDQGKKFVEAPINGGSGAGGGGNGGASGKTITRTAFDALDQSARAAFAKDGGKVVDQAA